MEKKAAFGLSVRDDHFNALIYLETGFLDSQETFVVLVIHPVW